MTNQIVFDTSVSAVWFIDDEAHPSANASSEIAQRGGGIVPQLWHFEIRNAILVAARRGRIRADRFPRCVRLLEGLPIHTDHHTDFDNVFELATKYDLTFYDATYLELALRHSLPLATLDNALTRAAESEGALWAP